LCHQSLNDKESGVIFFPMFKRKPTLKPFLKWFMLLNVLSIFITGFLDIQDSQLSYALIVSTINVYAIILVLVAFKADFWTLKVSKIIIVTLIGLLVLTIVLGDVYWLLEFVMPIVLTLNTTLYVLITFFKKERSTDDIYHSAFMSMLGFIPGILTFTSLLNVLIPSQISVIVSIFTMLYLLIFYPKLLLEGIKRRYHI
jgi:hypothetical protein